MNIPATDFTRRRDRLKAEASARGLEGVLVFSWRRRAVTWLTGYSPGFISNYAALWLPVEGEPLLGIRFGSDGPRAERVSGLRTVGGVDPIAVLPVNARRVGVITGDFAVDERPPSLEAEFGRRRVATSNLMAVLDSWRARKTGEDILRLTKATHLGAVALVAGGAVAPVGETDFAVAARVEAVARAGGAERALCLVGIGNAAVTEASGTVIGEADQVSVELTLYLGGVCAQVIRTILPAHPSRNQKTAIAICQSVRHEIVRALQPGRSASEVVAAGELVLEKWGLWDAVEYDFGHGIGADTPEYPRLIHRGEDVIESEMVTAVHVGIRKHDGMTAFLGGPVLIREGGSRELIDKPEWAAPHERTA